MIAMCAAAGLRQRLAAVDALELRCVEHVDDVLVLRIGNHVRVVERALPHVSVFIDERPGRAGIVGAEQPALFVFDERIDSIGIGARHAHADATDHARRQAGVACDFRPGFACIGGLEQAAARPAARHRVLHAEGFPHRCVHHVGIGAIDGKVDGRCLVVAEQHASPRLAAVGALVDAPLIVRSAHVAKGGNPDDVRVGGMHADFRDVLFFAEPDVCPGLACVGGLVDAIARHDVAANARFAHPYVHDVGIGFRHGHGADRRTLDLTIGHGRPGFTAVRCFPEAATDGAKVCLPGPTLHTTRGNRPTAAIGADAAPAQ